MCKTTSASSTSSSVVLNGSTYCGQNSVFQAKTVEIYLNHEEDS